MKTKSKGCFKQEANGTWSINTRVKVGDEVRHLKRTGYRTLSEAKADFENQKNDFIKKFEKKHTCETFDDLLDKYYQMRYITVNETTVDSNKSAIKLHILTTYGGKRLENCFTKSFVSNWYNSLVNNTKLSQSRKSTIISLFKDILKFAYMHEYIDAKTYQSCDVVVYQVKYSKKPNSERIIWTSDEEKQFLETIKNKNLKDYIMFKLFLVLGARIGEFLALQGNCFDAKKQKIEIKQQVVNVAGKGIVLTETLKTHESYRSVLIPSDICNLLSQYIADFNIKQDEYLFFYNNHKEPLSRTSFKRKLKQYCSLANVRLINPHAVRHQQAVKLASVCETGDDIEAAAHRLGHSTSMFMNTYANHTNDEKENELLKRIYKS